MANITLPGFDERDQLRQNASLRHVAEDLKANYAPLVSPAFTTPSLGVATATSLNGLTITSTTGTLTVALGKTLTWSNTITIAGTDGSTLNVGAGGTLGSLAYLSAAPAGTLTGTTLNSTVVTSSLTGLGTVTTGVWQATAVGVAYGGTGQTSLTANNVILGNGTSAVQFVAPGASGNVLTSNGTTWTSAAPPTTWALVKKTSDQSISSNTSLADDSALQFTMAANKTYAIRAYYSVSVGTGGVKISFNGPSSPTRLRFGAISGAGTSGASFQNGSLVASLYDTAIFNFTGGSSVMAFHFQGVVENGSTAGTFAMRIAQSSSSASATVYEKGSWLEYVEIA